MYLILAYYLYHTKYYLYHTNILSIPHKRVLLYLETLQSDGLQYIDAEDNAKNILQYPGIAETLPCKINKYINEVKRFYCV